MSFSDAIRTCLRKYVTFSGRASRPEYWYFFLFTLLLGLAASIIDSAVFGVSSDSDGPASLLTSLFIFLPMLAAGFRRMHDTGRSGLYLFYPLIALVGVISFAAMMGAADALSTGNFEGLFTGLLGIVMIFAVIVLILSPLIVLWWLTRPSQPGANQYGANPKEVSS
ncbi:DUF805 domain-containing protein [Pseudooceanicola nanhaiensis]|uniref:DUF805 domain-containing protein n=1 Tax=Pseudooceanicola nanhaiensis TaxID=375761 RepID=UPI001CD46E94|nr:DUF805 domain-containing protein [Pseudooceanicola nanhaiensis]MCA0919122.1 DUF805 domain-containing protein [Pseudooceanicola nanhaiensis]